MSLTIKVKKVAGIYQSEYSGGKAKEGHKVRWEIEPRTDVLEIEWVGGVSPVGSMAAIVTSGGRSAEYTLIAGEGKYPYSCKVNGVAQPSYSGGTVEILPAD